MLSRRDEHAGLRVLAERVSSCTVMTLARLKNDHGSMVSEDESDGICVHYKDHR